MSSLKLVTKPMATFVVALLSSSFLWSSTNAECADAVRVRKPWHSLNDYDQMMYVNGFQEIAKRKVLLEFIAAHQKATGSDEYNIHKSAQNFYWHSYWIYELENAFRGLGGEYECFTLPYWDVTQDGTYWINTANPDINDIPIYQTKLGGEGDIDNDYCVDGIWSLDHYATDSLCADDEVNNTCCLKRWHADTDDLNRTTKLYKPEHVGKWIWDGEQTTFSHFTGKISGMHGYVHSFFGSRAGTHFCGDGGGSPTYDPLFPVFHTFIEYLRLLHEDCSQFDTVSADDLDDLQPYSYDPTYKSGNTSLDYVMDFSIICDETDGKKVAMCSDNDITPRLMYDISPNTPFNIMYELGPFWKNNDNLQSLCGDSLNATWWTDADVGTETDFGVTGDNAMAEEEFVREHGVHSEYRVSVAPTLLIVSALMAMALLRYYVVRGREKVLDNEALNNQRELVYGTV